MNIGDKIVGRLHTYTVLESLGVGGFGDAYIVEDEKGEKFVAKRTLSEAGIDQITTDFNYVTGDYEQTDSEIFDEQKKKIHKEIKRYGNEIAILYKLKKVCGKYIVCVRDVSKVSPRIVIMDYIPDAENLYTRIRNKMSSTEKFKIIISLIRGLKMIQANDIAHRDIKPENILVDRQDNAYYIDFGLSCSLKPRTQLEKECLSLMRGSLPYMPGKIFVLDVVPLPEKIEILKEADKFALCVVIVMIQRKIGPHSARKIVDEALADETKTGTHSIVRKFLRAPLPSSEEYFQKLLYNKN